MIDDWSTTPRRFAVSSHNRHNQVVMAVEGELTGETAPVLLAMVDSTDLNRHRRLVLDLGAVTLIDEAGHRAVEQVRRSAGRVRPVTLRSPVRPCSSLLG